MDDNRKKALAAALGQIEKQFGKGSVMRLGDDNTAKGMEAISTGSIGLDVALGIGGLPRGRVVEIYGPESSGKTTLTLQVIAEAPSCWSPSPTPVSRRSKLPTCWCVPAPSISS
jgi:recombination protein RecA